MTGGEIVGMLLVAGVVAMLLYSRQSRATGDLVPKGLPLPEMMAEGWLNADGPVSEEALVGKVVVVDCWATWCPPCRAAMPELAKLYAEYEPMGVAFVGLTSESESSRPAIERFIQSVEGFHWPVGYGARPTTDALGIQVLPTVIVFDSTGRAVWSSSQLGGIEDVLDQALATAVRE